jgi:hypothetical protein
MATALTVRLNAISYGQPRHVILRADQKALAAAMANRDLSVQIKAKLDFTHGSRRYPIQALMKSRSIRRIFTNVCLTLGILLLSFR